MPSAIERCVDDEEFLIENIVFFMDDESFSQLKEALDAKDLAKAFDAAHALKGVSANLGLTTLFNAIVAIVEPLRHKEEADYASLYLEIMKKKEEVSSIIHS